VVCGNTVLGNSESRSSFRTRLRAPAKPEVNCLARIMRLAPWLTSTEDEHEYEDDERFYDLQVTNPASSLLTPLSLCCILATPQTFSPPDTSCSIYLEEHDSATTLDA
jgi:hypothetical protein